MYPGKFPAESSQGSKTDTITSPQKMNGRFFAGRRIEASLYLGKQRYRRTGAGEDGDDDGDDAEKERLDDFANWLMSEDN